MLASLTGREGYFINLSESKIKNKIWIQGLSGTSAAAFQSPCFTPNLCMIVGTRVEDREQLFLELVLFLPSCQLGELKSGHQVHLANSSTTEPSPRLFYILEYDI